MKDFTIAEDFPKNEIGFDKRFFDPKACYDYLFKQKEKGTGTLKIAVVVVPWG